MGQLGFLNSWRLGSKRKDIDLGLESVRVTLPLYSGD